MPADSFEKLPPSDVTAEKCTLGSLLLLGNDREAFSKVRRVLWREAFYTDDHVLILDVIDALHAAGTAIDAMTVRAELLRRQLLEEIGGVAYLGELLSTVPSAAHAEHYAGIVAARAKEREAIRIADELSKRLLNPIRGDDANAYIKRAATALEQVAMIGREVSVWRLSEAVDRFMQTRANGAQLSVKSGFTRLDEDFRGVFTPGGYTIVAARPSMGKSTFIRSLLGNQSTAGLRCGLIAVEEPEDKIAGNYISAESDVENSRVAYGHESWTAQERERISCAVEFLSGVNFWGTDSAFSLGDVLNSAEMLISRHRCQVIAIDHIHLVTGARSDNREQQISEISAAFKEFIKRHNIVGVVAAQLNRPERGAEPPPPALTDLRGSGALEEHADVVVMLHRRDYYNRGGDDYQSDGLCEVYIRKNRNGRVGDFIMRADLAHQRFEDRDDPVPDFA